MYNYIRGQGELVASDRTG